MSTPLIRPKSSGLILNALRDVSTRFWQPYQQRFLIVLFYAFIAAGVMAPITSETVVPNLADYINHLVSIIQANIAFNNGEFLLRIIPLEHGGWGYPVYQFYSPTSYMIAGFIYHWLTPNNPMIAFKLSVLGAMIIGGVYMYRLADWFIDSKPVALLAGVAYLTAPYYIVVIDQMGSFGEPMGLGILPAVIFYSLQSYSRPGDTKNLLLMSFSWYLLVTMHIVTFVGVSLFLPLLLVLVTLKNPKRFRNLISVGIGYSFGCLLAMWYLGPAALLQKFLVIENTFINPEIITATRPLLSQLLFSSAAITRGYISALLSFHPSVGWPMVFGGGYCIYAYFNHIRSGQRRADYFMPVILVCFLVAFFLVWSPIDIWSWLPQPLRASQRSSRLLGQVMWMGALLFSYATYVVFNNRFDFKHLLIGTVLIVMSTSAWYPNIKTIGMDLPHFINNPLLIYNDNLFLLDFSRYRGFINNTDTILVNDKHEINERSTYNIPTYIFKLASHPVLQINLTVPENILEQQLQLIVSMNNKVIGQHLLNTEKFSWSIPFSATEIAVKKTNTFPLTFKFANNKIKPAALKNINIPLSTMLLSGFMNANARIESTDMQRYCMQHYGYKMCKVMVPENIKLLELPVLYYPDMLSVTLNGKPVEYKSVLNKGQLVVGVTPVAGMNTIKIKFRGYEWANVVSMGAWGGWVMLLGVLLWQRNRQRM